MLWHDLREWFIPDIPRILLNLIQFCKEERTKIPPDHCTGLIRNHRKGLDEVIAAKRRANQLLKPRVHILCPPCTVNVYTVCSIKT
jgi:hypothetical protein